MKASRWLVALALAAVTGVGLLAPGASAEPSGTEGPRRNCPTLDPTLAWYGANRARLQDLVDTYGRCGRGGRPVALFDWDNTVVKNDVGDAMTYWMLRHDKVRQPGDWSRTSPFLTVGAVAALRGACGAGAVGTPLRTSADTACADEILAVYGSGRTSTGTTAFDGYDHRRMEPSYAWAAQLLAGYTEREVRGFAAAARDENLGAAVGATQTVGTHQVTGWVRYYDQQRDLITVMRRAGFDVWIVSASPQPVVEVWARGVGINPGNVIGIRGETRHGRLTYQLGSCGGARNVITYIDGKRCFVNQEIHGVRGPRAFQKYRNSHVFAAGDSDTDVTFVRDATALRLVVNRNKAELMCRAYADADGRWIVNPMFIEPKLARPTAYPCSTTGYVDTLGVPGPVLDDNGAVIPDQPDRVS
ncbi:haloacid dehalogenase-like hydrolase [Longispora sp. NPDC051575]|uniref:haloacid dehalogenase-like hydrolase n=1 Tax=Longispora sp. NPDC051575 TaxID=3154943 RepID=UPI003447CE0A